MKNFFTTLLLSILFFNISNPSIIKKDITKNTQTDELHITTARQ